MAMEEKSAGAMTRRGFLTALGPGGRFSGRRGPCWLRAKTANRGQLATTRPPSLTLAPWWKPDIPEEKILEDRRLRRVRGRPGRGGCGSPAFCC